MGYRITYEQSMIRTTFLTKRVGVRNKKWLVTIIICILIGVTLSNGAVRNFLLPGDPAVTQKALNDLAVNLKEGEPVSDAITAFSREILNNA